MMTRDLDNISLKKILRANLTQLSEPLLEQFDAEKKIHAISHCLKKQSSKLNWENIRKEILWQMDSLLDIPLHSVLTRSWEHCEKVQRLAEAQIDSGLDTVSIVPLRSHKIHSRQCPQITLGIDTCERIILPISIELNLSLSNVVVKLQHGKIINIISGLCKGAGVVKYEHITLLNRKIPEFHLLECIDNQDTLREAA